jgi:hypothetical protein
MRNKKWVRLLAYVTGSVSQELPLQNEYLGAENSYPSAFQPATALVRRVRSKGETIWMSS